MTWAEGSYHSISGKIEVKWKKEKGKFQYDIVVPVNTTATVHMPSTGSEQVWLDGKKLSDVQGITNVNFVAGYVVFELVSGTYGLQSVM